VTTRRAFLSALAALPVVGRMFRPERTPVASFDVDIAPLNFYSPEWRYFVFTKEPQLSGFYERRGGSWVKRG